MRNIIDFQSLPVENISKSCYDNNGTHKGWRPTRKGENILCHTTDEEAGQLFLAMQPQDRTAIIDLLRCLLSAPQPDSSVPALDEKIKT